MTESTLNYCYVHPTRETSLRCKRCERYICTSCARSTPTGYMCRECVRSHQKSFETSEWYDFILGFITAGFLSGIASFLVTLIGGFGFFGWFIILGGTPVAATVISEGVRYATRRHRSRPLFITCAAGVVAGALPVIVFQAMTMNVFGLVFQVIYLIIAVPFVYTRLSGIQFFR